MKTKINNIFFSVLFLLVSGCTSYNIKYPDNLKKTTINASLYIPALPANQTMQYPGGLASAFYAGTFENTINTSYSQVDLKKMFITEFSKVPAEKQKLVKLVIDENVQKISIPSGTPSAEELKKNPYLSKYQFDKVRDKINTPYLFELKVLQWGHNGKKAASQIKYNAALYDCKTGDVIWAKHNTTMETTSLLSNNVSFNKEKATEYLHVTVKKIVEECIESINKK